MLIHNWEVSTHDQIGWISTKVLRDKINKLFCLSETQSLFFLISIQTWA